MVYAGFWRRFGAGIIDHILMGGLLVFGPFGPWLYYAFFHSSKYQATPGMMALSLRIVGYDGKRISFGRATGRFLATFLSVMTFGIGYIMIAFTPRKQALHDYIAKTLIVVDKKGSALYSSKLPSL